MQIKDRTFSAIVILILAMFIVLSGAVYYILFFKKWNQLESPSEVNEVSWVNLARDPESHRLDNIASAWEDTFPPSFSVSNTRELRNHFS